MTSLFCASHESYSMNPSLSFSASLRIFAVFLILLSAGCATQSSRTEPVSLRVIAFNDFHGNLKTPGAMRVPDPKDSAKQELVVAGGAAYLATAVKSLRQGSANSIVVGAGDLVSGSPLISSLFLDEPAIEALGLIGLDIASVGNHEFDRGRTELVRLANGGCRADGCVTGSTYGGARFHYLAANVIDVATNKPLLPAYEIRKFDGVPIAFIGLTLKGTPAIVTRSGIAGLRFDDEAETVNALVPILKSQGVEAIVVLIHEGGNISGHWSDQSCPGFSGPIIELARRFDKAVDLIVSGHTHRAYTCKLDDRWITSAGEYGRFATRIDLKLSPQTRDVISVAPQNMLVDIREYSQDPAVVALIEKYEKLAAPKAGRIVGYLTGELLPVANQAGESTLGSVIADAQLAASLTAGAQVAFMNPGGVRAALSPRSGGGITYGDIFTAQPFGNNLVTLTFTGAQIHQILEDQFARNPAVDRNRVLHPSQGFSYTWDNAKPHGSKVVFESISLNGQPLERDKRYRVTVNSFLADGGDGFSILRSGVQREGGVLDLDALETWLAANAMLTKPFAPPLLTRIKRLN
jgi:5'-nucleotidase